MYNNKNVIKNNEGKLIIKKLFNKIKIIQVFLFLKIVLKMIIIDLFQILYQV